MTAVRLARLDDAEIIARQTSNVQWLHSEALAGISTVGRSVPTAEACSALRDPNSIVAVAEIDSKSVGHIYGAVNRAENAFNRQDAYVYMHQIGVDEGARRQGVGTALVAFIRDRAEVGHASRSLGV